MYSIERKRQVDQCGATRNMAQLVQKRVTSVINWNLIGRDRQDLLNSRSSEDVRRAWRPKPASYKHCLGHQSHLPQNQLGCLLGQSEQLRRRLDFNAGSVARDVRTKSI